MPLPVIYSQRGSCSYQMCETEGHSVCRVFGAYYERLCDLAQKAVDDPTPENLSALKAALAENAGLEGSWQTR